MMEMLHAEQERLHLLIDLAPNRLTWLLEMPVMPIALMR
jgi:hypothetical protein